MKIVSEKKTKIRPLNLIHLSQLQAYCEWAEQDGGYYGFKPDFDKRHNEIKAWLKDCIDTLENK